MATIAWLIPPLLEGSGGHRTFLQHADDLQRHGHRCIIYMENPGQLSGASLRKEVRRLFGYDFEDVRAGWAAIQPADMVFATIWYSAKVVRDLAFPCVKAYFVQDFEAQFNPMGDGYLMAENSYRYGLHPISIGRWLPAMLSRDFGVAASHFDFCADLGIYRQLPGVAREKAVCFIHQPDKPRRCAELGIETLGIVKHVMPDVKIYLYGSKLPGRVWFEHENLGLLNLDACNQLYNRCTAGLCISTTNPSRIPFEMMAAGLPVVEVFRDNTLFDFPEAAMTLCQPTPESLARGLMDLLNAPDRATEMGAAGAAFMLERPLAYGLSQFRTAVEELLAGRSPPLADNLPMYRRPVLVAGNLASGPALVSGGLPPVDIGRLAFLPPFPRKVVRHFYHRFRRFWS